MKRYCLVMTVLALGWNTLGQGAAPKNAVSLQTVQAAVEKVLSYPSYSAADETILNRAGDMAARAMMQGVPAEEMKSREQERLILLVLQMAFEEPQMIEKTEDRKGTQAMLLLDQLAETNHGGEAPTAVENVRNEIRYNTSTGKPQVYVTFKGEAPVDWDRWQWVGNVLAWANTIKPGMTRKELLRVYTMEGGLSTRTWRTYVLKGCPTIKVDVEFAAVGAATEPGGESAEDKIVKISKPYLDYVHVD